MLRSSAYHSLTLFRRGGGVRVWGLGSKPPLKMTKTKPSSTKQGKNGHGVLGCLMIFHSLWDLSAAIKAMGISITEIRYR